MSTQRGNCAKCEKKISSEFRKLKIEIYLGSMKIDPGDIKTPCLEVCANCRRTLSRMDEKERGKLQVVAEKCVDKNMQTERQFLPLVDRGTQTTPLQEEFMEKDPWGARPQKKPRHEMAKIAECLSYWQEHLSDGDFQSKIRAILNNQKFRDDFIDVLPQTIAFEKTLKKLREKHAEIFLEISYLLHSLCGIGQRLMQDVVRNHIFKKLQPLLYINPIVPISQITEKRQHFTEEILKGSLGFRSMTSNDTVGVIGNVQKILEWYLRFQGTGEIYLTPNDLMYTILYCDAYPFFKNSKNCNSQGSVQLRIVSNCGIVDVLPVARWFGEDTYKFTSFYARKVHEQFKDLEIEFGGKKVKVKRTLLSDGKSRREESGKSAATSLYGLPEAPVRKDQYSDMTIIAPILSTAQRTNYFAQKWQQLGIKPSVSFLLSSFFFLLLNFFFFKKNQSAFERSSKGESGRENFTGVDMHEWFLGHLHAILNSQARFVLSMYQMALRIGNQDDFLQDLKAARVCRKLIEKPIMKIKFDERGWIESNFKELNRKKK